MTRGSLVLDIYLQCFIGFSELFFNCFDFLAVLAHLLTSHQHVNVCTVHCSQAFLSRKRHFQYELIFSCLCTRMLAGLVPSRLARASEAIPSCTMTSYAFTLRNFVSVWRTHLGLSARRFRESLKHLRVKVLLNLEHRESSHY